jgi:hypothetical protein
MAFLDIDVHSEPREVILFAGEYDKYRKVIDIMSAGSKIEVEGKKSQNKMIVNKLTLAS